MMDFEEFHKQLFALQDANYRVFQVQMLPSIDEKRAIGIRSAALIKFAKKFFDEESKAEFITTLPHKYFEEDLIHIWIISKIKNYNECIKAVKKFLPYIDNWAVCDSLIPKVFAQHTDKLLKEIKNWLASGSTYTTRFAIFMLMKFYLGKNFDKNYLQMVAEVQTREYYVEMMAAWFFTEALINHYDTAIIFLQDRLVLPKIQTKIIQKSVDSTRLSDKKKEYLKTLRRRYW